MVRSRSSVGGDAAAADKDDASMTKMTTREKEPNEIVEFNALPSFPNSVKWHSHNNKIALQISDSTYVVNVHNDTRDVVQWEPLDTQEAYATMSYHLKDRYIYHPSMFARYQTRNGRCSEWSPIIVLFPQSQQQQQQQQQSQQNSQQSQIQQTEAASNNGGGSTTESSSSNSSDSNSGNHQIADANTSTSTSESVPRQGARVTCFLAVCSTDHMLRIYAEPEKSYDRKWREVYDVRALLRAACEQFYDSEVSNANNQFQPQNKRLRLSLPPEVLESGDLSVVTGGGGNGSSGSSGSGSSQVQHSQNGGGGGGGGESGGEEEGEDVVEMDDATVSARKLTDSFLNVLVAGFVKISNFLEPEELEKKKRRYSDEETKFINTKMEQLFRENESLMKQYKLNAKTLKSNLLKRMKVRTRTIANKKRNGESLSDLDVGSDHESPTVNAPPQEERSTTAEATPEATPAAAEATTTTTTTDTDATSASSSSSSAIENVPSTPAKSSSVNNSDTVTTPTKSQQQTPSLQQQTPSSKATPSSTTRKRMLRVVTNIENIDTPEEFVHIEHISDMMCIAWSHAITESDVYFACGNKTGHIAIMRFNPNKKQILTVACYFKAHFSFVTSICFIKAGPTGCCLVSGASDGSVNFWTVPLLIEQEPDQILLSLDCVFPFADLAKSIPNTFVPPDHVPINFMSRYEYGGNTYLYIVKGCSCYIAKIASNLTPIWHRTFEGHSSIITGIAPLMCHYSTEQLPILLIYSASYDGSLILWRVNDTDGTSEKHVIIARDCAHPIWGCSLSPNQTHVAILREKPPQIANRADLEDRHKTKLFVFPVYEHLDGIVPPSDTRTIDYHFASLCQVAHRGMDARLNPFDIVDGIIDNLSTGQALEIVDKVINNLTSSQILLQLSYLILAQLTSKYNLMLRAAMVGSTQFDVRVIQSEYQAIGYRQFQTKNKLFSQNIMPMIRSINEMNSTQLIDRATLLLKCDWMLLYQSHSITQCMRVNLSDMTEIGSLVTEDLRHLKSLYARFNQPEQLCAHIDRLIELCSRQPESLQSVESVTSELTSVLPCRDACPFCSEPVQMSLDHVLAGQCPRNERHKFNRDVFSFAIIKQVGAATCQGCGCKTMMPNQQSILSCPLCGNIFEHRLKIEL